VTQTSGDPTTERPDSQRGFVIRDIRATTVAMPLEAPIRHASGAHWGKFIRTLVEIETEDGLIGVGEMGGGGQSAEAAILDLRRYLIGHNPFDLEALRFKICNPTASLYNNRTQMHAAIEFACLDLVGRKLGVPVHDLLGGRVRDQVPFASYLFYRYGDPDTGAGEVRTPDQLVAQAQELKAANGFRSHKLKGGVYAPEYEIECYRALAAAFPDDSFRYDPNCVLSVAESLWVARHIADLRNDYLEDPTWGLNGMRALRGCGQLLATNTMVVNFEQLAANILQPAIDVILLDTTFWGGIRACVKAAGVCETFQLPIAVHSSGELGVQLATMLHLGATVPNLTFSADAHYHHLVDDVIVDGKLPYSNGCIDVPTGPGLGVELDADKVATYAELYRSVGGYPYDRDPGRLGWYPLVPNTKWDDPAVSRRPTMTASGY
jgi:glucarate dehydratase